MKLQGLFLCALLSALLLLTAACGNGDVSPTPAVKPSPTPKAEKPAVQTPAVTPSPQAEQGAAEGAATIEGFVEGAAVELKALPEKVTAALKERFPDATLKGATYATYMNGQMFRLTLEGAKDGTTDVYAKADGTLLPYEPDATPAGTPQASPGGSGAN